jgi:hypothetical protein
MRELYIEGVAVHGGPEPCVVARKGGGEASVGVRVGWAIEPRNWLQSRCRRPRNWRKATLLAAFSRAVGGPRGVQEPVHARSLHAREPGDPTVTRSS